jgi:hypothetical protein
MPHFEIKSTYTDTSSIVILIRRYTRLAKALSKISHLLTTKTKPSPDPLPHPPNKNQRKNDI